MIMNRTEISENVTIIPAISRKSLSTDSNRLTRVAAYCRVSTEEENQKNSYAAQISYYTEYSNSAPEWKLVGIFADEGISGTRTKKRAQFNSMMELARKNKIDIILCKSISRFARNTVDCLDCIRELKSLGVTVIFEKENINTSTVSSEFAISLYASFAQAESESISKNVTWGIERSFREGNVRYQMGRTLGYRMGADGKPYIVEDEAQTVRKIFSLYAEGHRAEEIAGLLTKEGAVRRNGSSVWERFHVYQILKNEKYVGDALLQKTYTVNCLTHERAKNCGQKPMYFVQNSHKGIIDRRTYDAVRLELEKRKRRREYGKKQGSEFADPVFRTRYSLSRCLVCPYCGSYYKRCTWILKEGKVGMWRCKNRLTGNHCPKSFSYRESDLHSAILNAINNMMAIPPAAAGCVNSSAEIHKKLSDELDRINKNISETVRELTQVEITRNELLSAVSGSMIDKVSAELTDLNRREAEIADRLDSLKYRRDLINKEQIKADNADKLLNEFKAVKVFDETLLPRFVTRIDALDKNEIIITFANGAVSRSKIK